LKSIYDELELLSRHLDITDCFVLYHLYSTCKLQRLDALISMHTLTT
jgi:hypothetical protein